MSIDITGKICDLHPSYGDWPMYSYERPAWLLWNTIANALHDKGWTEDQIKEWLQSKDPRIALDGGLGNEIQKLGKAYVEQFFNKR